MTDRFDKWQAKSFPEKVGDFHCFLADATGVARALLRLYHKITSVCGSMTKTKIDGRIIVLGNHHKRDSKDLGYIIPNINEE